VANRPLNRAAGSGVENANQGGFDMDAHDREYLAAIAGMQDVYGAAGNDQATPPAQAAASPAPRPTIRCSAGPAAIVVMTHMSTQATNSRSWINSAS